MFSFKEFLAIVEMTDVVDDITDNIPLKRSGDSLSYNFSIDGQQYVVNFIFHPCYEYNSYAKLTDTGFEIQLQGPSGYGLTGSGKGPTIYRHLLKAVKKVIKEENPEGLYFYGAATEQDIMYNSFYERFLKKEYTQVDRKNYIRNDLIKQWQETGDPRFQLIQQSMQELQADNPIDKYKKQKEQKRNKVRMLPGWVGKIIWDDDYSQPVYVSGVVPPDKLKVIYWNHNNSGGNRTLRLDYARNISEEEKEYYKEQIKRLFAWVVQNLNTKPQFGGSSGLPQGHPILRPGYQGGRPQQNINYTAEH